MGSLGITWEIINISYQLSDQRCCLSARSGQLFNLTVAKPRPLTVSYRNHSSIYQVVQDTCEIIDISYQLSDQRGCLGQ